jgi:hypothetical protein
LYEDVIGGDSIQLGTFLEIHLHELLSQGYDYNEAVRLLRGYSLSQVEKIEQ